MKLFLILYVSNSIGGTWGPLPYDMAECQSRAIEKNAELQTHEEMKTWTVVCEYRLVRPRLGEKRP
jgi:hypothetical protein